MSTMIICDGCGEPMPEGEGTTEGIHDKADYCSCCAGKYAQWEEAVREKRRMLAEEFEAFLAEHREAARKMGLKRLPDDPGVPVKAEGHGEKKA